MRKKTIIRTVALLGLLGLIGGALLPMLAAI